MVSRNHYLQIVKMIFQKMKLPIRTRKKNTCRMLTLAHWDLTYKILKLINYIKMKTSVYNKSLVVLGLLLLVPMFTYAADGADLLGLKNFLDSQGPIVKQIVAWILNIILLVCMVYVIYAYSTKKENAKD